MDKDIKDLLEKNLEATQRILYLTEKMHRASLWARFFTLVKWVIIIAAAVWGYVALQPYLQQLMGLQQSLPALNSLGGLKGMIGK